MTTLSQTHLKELEHESIYIFREVAAEFERPVLLYSVGKDSSVLLHLARKAFYPGLIPFPFMHIDTSYKHPEMIRFRNKIEKENKIQLLIYKNEHALKEQVNPYDFGIKSCCKLLKTEALLNGLKKYQFDAAFGGARRDEEKSRSKERIFSFRDKHGQWDPKNQRPELWNLYNANLKKGESIRVFPLSNWTELDIWHYIQKESIPIVPLYLARKRRVIQYGEALIPLDDFPFPEQLKGEVREVMCRFRTLGCSPCTGAIPSTATTIDQIVEEMHDFKASERATRLIDHDSEDAMEEKKREGYF